MLCKLSILLRAYGSAVEQMHGMHQAGVQFPVGPLKRFANFQESRKFDKTLFCYKPFKCKHISILWYSEIMEQHPIPRQITTFEFKLIGFLTIKQFMYLVIFIPLGLIVYYIFPVPLLNILLGVITGLLGVAFAFLPINDRPLDVWIINFFRRMTSPTQYLFHKHNEPLYFLRNLVFVNDPHRVMAHVEAQEKLSNYLSIKNPPVVSAQKKQGVNNLFQMASSALSGNTSKKPEASHPRGDQNMSKTQEMSPQTSNIQPSTSSPKHPFFTGVIKNHKLIPIPGIMIYVKDNKGVVLRLLKSNPHGVFATFNPLPQGEYSFEIKDPNSSYIFDTMKMKIDQANNRPFEFYSKELL